MNTLTQSAETLEHEMHVNAGNNKGKEFQLSFEAQSASFIILKNLVYLVVYFLLIYSNIKLFSRVTTTMKRK